MTQEELETMANKIAEVAPDQLPVFLNNPEAFDYNVLEGYSDFTNKYKSVADFVGDKNAIKAQIWNNLNGKFPSEARFQSLQEQYPWLNKKELKEWFDKTNEYRKFYKEEAEKEAGRKRRASEIAGTYTDLINPEEAEERNWSLFKNILTSDYEKQRYINEPETALFGYDAPKLGEAPETRTAAIGDLAAGSTAAVADFIPPLWWAGPTIRAGRDVGYKLTGSKYAKDGGDILKGIGADYGINLAAKFLPNLRKGERIATTAADPTVAKTLATVDAEKVYKNSIDAVKSALERGEPVDIIKTVETLPEGEVKTRLMKYAQSGKTLQSQKLEEEIARLELSLDPTIQSVDELMSKFGIGSSLGENAAEFAKNKTIYNMDNLSRMQKLQYGASRVANILNRGNPGQIMMQEVPNLYGRGVGKVRYTEYTPEEQQSTINRIISSYSLLWNKDKEPPEAKNNPLIKAAWEKWREE